MIPQFRLLNSGIAVHDTAGHVIEACTNNDCNGTANVVTDEWFSDDAKGQETDMVGVDSTFEWVLPHDRRISTEWKASVPNLTARGASLDA